MIAIATIGAAAFFFAELASAPMRTRRNLVHRAANYGRIRTITGREMPRFRERAFAPFITKMARLMLRVNPKSTTEVAAGRLMAAGMRKTSPTGFIASKGILAIGGAFAGLLIATATAPKFALPLLFFLGVAGFAAPGLYVNSRAKRRQAAVAADLPDALDLLSVSVEAGLGFDGAVQKLTEHMDGPLIEEFDLALGEMRIGEGRQEALKKISDRSSSPEMASFVRAIIQADQLGISLGRILKVQAGDTRLKRQLLAEEKAMKAPIKMLFPTVVFIFPAMFLVV
ncbi:MAG TPA: type II secretion system F family protein, partial [Thermoanaerobaculia bacterium]|nr:type II secretion system F family protein [Thermoanaerobaculia bacterium]